jgi:hypothetical protein
MGFGYHSNNKIENQAAWSDEFSAYDPDPDLVADEAGGMQSGGHPYELDEGRYPLMWPVKDNFPYPVFIEHMLEVAWQAATVSNTMGPQRQLSGTHRAAAVTPAIQAAATYNAPLLHYAGSSKSSLKGVAKDWCRMLEFDRVEGYAFRGDSRDPMTIKAHGGFNPPCTRTDDYYLDKAVIPNFKKYMKARFGVDNLDEAALKKHIQGSKAQGEVFVRYEFWRSLMQQQEMHLGRMIAEEFLKGYISTSRSTRVAKGYAKTTGWVYVLYVKGAFKIGALGSHDWAVFGEQELAMPAAVPWHQVYGFRAVGGGQS